MEEERAKLARFKELFERRHALYEEQAWLRRERFQVEQKVLALERRAERERRRLERRAGSADGSRRGRPVRIDVDDEAWAALKREAVRRRLWLVWWLGELIRIEVEALEAGQVSGRPSTASSPLTGRGGADASDKVPAHRCRRRLGAPSVPRHSTSNSRSAATSASWQRPPRTRAAGATQDLADTVSDRASASPTTSRVQTGRPSHRQCGARTLPENTPISEARTMSPMMRWIQPLVGGVPVDSQHIPGVVELMDRQLRTGCYAKRSHETVWGQQRCQFDHPVGVLRGCRVGRTMAAMAPVIPPTPAQRGLTLWARVAIGGFYRRVRVAGDPAELRGRPAVIVVNHSNALGDIALLLTVLPQFPRFLAASTWWNHAPVRALFRAGRVLPVERRGDGPGQQRNGDTFAVCHDALAAADHVAIFPEGTLNSGAALLPFRTGAARIALSAALDVGVRGLVIVPVAIAYEDRGRLRSDVVATFGAPIEIDEWIEQGRADPVGTVREMTDLLQERLADAHGLGLSQLERNDPASATERQLRTAGIGLLAPVAVAGVAANAPAVVPIRDRRPAHRSRRLAGDGQGYRRDRAPTADLDRRRLPRRQALGSSSRRCWSAPPPAAERSRSPGWGWYETRRARSIIGEDRARRSFRVCRLLRPPRARDHRDCCASG